MFWMLCVKRVDRLRDFNHNIVSLKTPVAENRLFFVKGFSVLDLGIAFVTKIKNATHYIGRNIFLVHFFVMHC